jgi:hypothetical protein
LKVKNIKEKVPILESFKFKESSQKVPIGKSSDLKKKEKVPKSKIMDSRTEKKKVPIAQKKSSGKRADVLRNQELVRAAYLKLEEELGKGPTRIQVAERIGLSSKKVGQYFRILNL